MKRIAYFKSRLRRKMLKSKRVLELSHLSITVLKGPRAKKRKAETQKVLRGQRIEKCRYRFWNRGHPILFQALCFLRDLLLKIRVQPLSSVHSSAVPSGLDHSFDGDPALKRWAIFEGSFGTRCRVCEDDNDRPPASRPSC